MLSQALSGTAKDHVASLTLSDDRCIAQKSDAALRDSFLSVVADT